MSSTLLSILMHALSPSQWVSILVKTQLDTAPANATLIRWTHTITGQQSLAQFGYGIISLKKQAFSRCSSSTFRAEFTGWIPLFRSLSLGISSALNQLPFTVLMNESSLGMRVLEYSVQKYGPLGLDARVASPSQSSASKDNTSSVPKFQCSLRRS